MKRYLVTGGLGHIGSHVVDALIARGDKVVIVDNLLTGKLEFKHPAAELLQISAAEVSESTALRTEPFDGVFHLAAFSHIRLGSESPVIVENNGANLTVAMLNLCVEQHIPKFVFVSSVAIQFNPSLPYSIEKAAGENYCAWYAKKFGQQVSMIRLHSVYGSPRHTVATGNLLPAFFDQRARTGKIQITGDGSQLRDFVYYTDAVSAILAAEDITGISEIGTGVGHSVLEVAKYFNCPIEFIGRPVVEAERQVCLKSDYPTEVTFETGMASLGLGPI